MSDSSSVPGGDRARDPSAFGDTQRGVLEKANNEPPSRITSKAPNSGLMGRESSARPPEPTGILSSIKNTVASVLPSGDSEHNPNPTTSIGPESAGKPNTHKTLMAGNMLGHYVQEADPGELPESGKGPVAPGAFGAENRDLGAGEGRLMDEIREVRREKGGGVNLANNLDVKVNAPKSLGGEKGHN